MGHKNSNTSSLFQPSLPAQTHRQFSENYTTATADMSQSSGRITIGKYPTMEELLCNTDGQSLCSN